MLRRRTIAALVLPGLLLGSLGHEAAAQNGNTKKLNPYTGKPEMIQEGRALYLQFGCSGCHGVMGGGGMGPPLIKRDDVWKFGSDDETLYKLIKGEIPDQKMPKAFGYLTDDQIWKMLAYIRSLYKGDPSKVNW